MISLPWTQKVIVEQFDLPISTSFLKNKNRKKKVDGEVIETPLIVSLRERSYDTRTTVSLAVTPAGQGAPAI